MFLDESGFMLQPLRRRTWAPPGKPPCNPLGIAATAGASSAASSLAPWALRIGVYFRLHDHNIVTADVEDFVKQFHRQIGRPLIVVWDRWNVHRSAAKRLARRRWVQIEYLPAYAPS